MNQGVIDSFTKLDTWQKSHELAVAVFAVLKNVPSHNSLKKQIERAAISITSNIAEGFGRQSIQDKKHFYIIARGSVFELQNQLLLARDINLISGEDFNKLAGLSVDSTKLLHGLIRSTRSKIE
jgi:four helix bundle protein